MVSFRFFFFLEKIPMTVNRFRIVKTDQLVYSDITKEKYSAIVYTKKASDKTHTKEGLG